MAPGSGSCSRMLASRLHRGATGHAARRSALSVVFGMRGRAALPGRRTDGAGTCAQALPAGQRCATAVDALASYTRFDQLDRQHPECQGFCGRAHLCESSLPLGAECVMSPQCGRATAAAPEVRPRHLWPARRPVRRWRLRHGPALHQAEVHQARRCRRCLRQRL